jgi:hypothetical protein
MKCKAEEAVDQGKIAHIRNRSLPAYQKLETKSVFGTTQINPLLDLL